MALRWCILKQDSQVALLRGMDDEDDDGQGVPEEATTLGVFEALKSDDSWMRDVGVRYGVLRNDRVDGVICMTDRPRRYSLGVVNGDESLSGGGGGGVLHPSPCRCPVLGSRVGVVFLR